MRTRWPAFGLGAIALGMATASTFADAEPTARSPAEQLRYIGRDYVTGRPAPIDDRFIAEVERAIERYGMDESEPIPPPPAGDVDVARVSIPDLGVEAAVARYGVDRYGRLDVPQDSSTIGWNPAFTGLPGSGSATFFAAHYEYGGTPGVFFRLAELEEGAVVEVELTDGVVHTYRVTSVVDYALGAIDMGALLAGREGVESITLMTCSGPSDDGEYAYRTVVLAEHVEG